MKQTITIKIGALLATMVCVFGTVCITASAHEDGDVDHETSHIEATKNLSIMQMEQLIPLLNQLINLLAMLKVEQNWSNAPVQTTPATPDNSAEMETHHTDHDSDVVADAPAREEVEMKLVIELEEHNDKTHAHVRYVDGKPEAMFFVDPPISNEDAVVSSISAQTGLAQDVVREALKYMQ
jgi:hypothetical protein